MNRFKNRWDPMKVQVFFVLLLTCLASINLANAQTDVSDSLMQRASEEYPLKYAGVLKTNPLSMLWGSIPVTAEYMVLYEFVTSPQQASQVGLSYISKSPILKLFEDTVPDLKLLTANGVRLQISHRFYLVKSRGFAPRGFYLAPHLSYATVRISTKHYRSRDVYIGVTQFNSNLLIGWQWIYDNNYTFDAFVGWGYKDNFAVEHDAQRTISLNTDDFGAWYTGPLKFSFGFHIGIAL